MLKIDSQRARQIVPLLMNTWNSKGILGSRVMPESQVPSGMRRGSSEHALLLTLTVAIDYMRDADQLWQASVDTFEDPEMRYLFDPNKVIQTGIAKLQEDLSRHKVVKKKNRDTQIWTTRSLPLSRDFEGKVEPLLARSAWDGPRTIYSNEMKLRGSTWQRPAVRRLW